MAAKPALAKDDLNVVTTSNGGSYVDTVDSLMSKEGRALLERNRQMWINAKKRMLVAGDYNNRRFAVGLKSK
jgi:hypothetical protein